MFKKILLLVLISSLLVSCGEEVKVENIVENEEINIEIIDESMEEVIIEEIVESKYKDLAEFISTELSEEDDNKILEILEQRSARQIEIWAMLNQAVIDGNIDEKLEEVREMRKVCAGRILPFVSEDKKEAFTAHCEAWNEGLKIKFSATIEETKEIKTYSMEKVASYSTSVKCRTIVEGKVYDITDFFGKHPGWDDKLSEICWKDWTEMFNNQHSSSEEANAQLESMYKWELEK